MMSKNEPTSASYSAKLFIAPSKSSIGSVLSHPIIQSCKSALHSRKTFTIALSGGSLPSFLQALSKSFDQAGVDPQWDKWHVLLADERCVVSTHADSNLSAIQSNFTDNVPIPKNQVYGIDEILLSASTDAIAAAYEERVLKPLLEKCGGMLDCVVLGFGPDGHTCSLFPNHPLLKEQSRLVAPIDDSPKPPPSRITLTLPFLNKLSRQIVFFGAGSSKSAMLKAVFGTAKQIPGGQIDEAKIYEVEMNDPPPYPCGMVRPCGNNLIWVVDSAAAEDAIVVEKA